MSRRSLSRKGKEGQPQRPLSSSAACPSRASTGKNPSWRTNPISAQDSTKSPGRCGGELRITHNVLDSALRPAAKLLLAAVERVGGVHVSYDRLEAVLPCRRRAIADAIREAEETGWLRVTRPEKRHTRSPVFTEANLYSLHPYASPHVARFTRLLAETDPGQSASRWILRAIYDREQARTGAVQLPDQLAARLAGATPKAVSLARAEWRNAGSLRQHARGSRERPGYFTLTHSPYPADLERFDPTRRSLVRVDFGPGVLTFWATDPQGKRIRQAVQRAERGLAADYFQALNPHGPILQPNALLNATRKHPDGGSQLDADTLEIHLDFARDPRGPSIPAEALP